MPRFEFNVKSAVVASKVPPFNVKWPADGEPGAAPKPLSALILSLPAEIVVTPVNVFVPDNVNVPEPALVKLPDPLITPDIITRISSC